MAKRIKGVKHIKGDVWLIDYQVDGKRLQERTNAKSLAEAKVIRQERIVELRKNSSMPQKEQERLNAPFSEAKEKLFADLRADNLAHTNMLRHRIIFERLFDKFAPLKFPHIKSVSQVSSPFFQEYKAYFINTLKHSPNGGWRSELICLKSMMRRFKKLGYCGKEIVDILADIKRPRHIKKAYPNITNTQLKELLDFIKNDRPDYYRIIYFICRTGRRINETSLIERKDVVWDGLNPVKINIRAETTKTGVDAPIERLDEDLANIVREAYIAGSKHKTIYLFSSRLGRQCDKNSVRTYLKEASKKIVGIEITPHYFRHRFLTECGKANVPIVDIMHIAGIKDIKVVMGYYSHVTSDGQDKVLAVTNVG